MHELYTSAPDPETQLPVLDRYLVQTALLGPVVEPPPEHAAGRSDRAGPHPAGAVVSEQSVLQRLAGWAADVADDIADLFVHQDVRKAVLADLGGKPGAATLFDLPEAPLTAVRQYRDRVDTDAQADAEAVANIAILLSAIIDQVEAWDADWPSRGDAFAHGLLDLLASASHPPGVAEAVPRDAGDLLGRRADRDARPRRARPCAAS